MNTFPPPTFIRQPFGVELTDRIKLMGGGEKVGIFDCRISVEVVND